MGTPESPTAAAAVGDRMFVFYLFLLLNSWDSSGVGLRRLSVLGLKSLEPDDVRKIFNQFYEATDPSLGMPRKHIEHLDNELIKVGAPNRFSRFKSLLINLCKLELDNDLATPCKVAKRAYLSDKLLSLPKKRLLDLTEASLKGQDTQENADGIVQVRPTEVNSARLPVDLRITSHAREGSDRPLLYGGTSRNFVTGRQQDVYNLYDSFERETRRASDSPFSSIQYLQPETSAQIGADTAINPKNRFTNFPYDTHTNARVNYLLAPVVEKENSAADVSDVAPTPKEADHKLLVTNGSSTGTEYESQANKHTFTSTHVTGNLDRQPPRLTDSSRLLILKTVKKMEDIMRQKIYQFDAFLPEIDESVFAQASGSMSNVEQASPDYPGEELKDINGNIRASDPTLRSTSRQPLAENMDEVTSQVLQAVISRKLPTDPTFWRRIFAYLDSRDFPRRSKRSAARRPDTGQRYVHLFITYGHLMPCDYRDRFYCMNGGTCVFVGALDIKTCRCPIGYTGVRCELIDQEYILSLLSQTLVYS